MQKAKCKMRRECGIFEKALRSLARCYKKYLQKQKFLRSQVQIQFLSKIRDNNIKIKKHKYFFQNLLQFDFLCAIIYMYD